MLAPLFTELNVSPIRYRRLVLALRFLSFALLRDRRGLVRLALDDPFSLLGEGQLGGTWAWNGSYNVLNPQFGFPVASIDEHQVAELEKAVWKLLKSRLSNEVDSSPHLYLIHNRLEPMPSGPPKKTIMFL